MAISNKVYDFGEQLYELSQEKGWEVGPGRKHGKVSQELDSQGKALGDSMKSTVNNIKETLCNFAKANGQAEPKSKEDFINIFKLIFSFMQDDMKMNSQVEVNQSLNMIVQSNLLDNLMKESSEELTDMQAKFDSIEHKLSGPLGGFLTIGLPILLAAVSLGAGACASSATSALSKGLLTALSGLTTATAAVPAQVCGSKNATEMQAQAAESQAKMSLGSAASDSANNTIKQGMQNAQNAQSNEQADLSMMQQELQQMVASYGMGH